MFAPRLTAAHGSSGRCDVDNHRMEPAGKAVSASAALVANWRMADNRKTRINWNLTPVNDFMPLCLSFSLMPQTQNKQQLLQLGGLCHTA